MHFFEFKVDSNIGWSLLFYTLLTCSNSVLPFIFFPGPLAFCKKAVERVSSEKNILNSSVECVEWSGVEWSGFF